MEIALWISYWVISFVFFLYLWSSQDEIGIYDFVMTVIGAALWLPVAIILATTIAILYILYCIGKLTKHVAPTFASKAVYVWHLIEDFRFKGKRWPDEKHWDS